MPTASVTQSRALESNQERHHTGGDGQQNRNGARNGA
jgi:hypothetical protein